MDTRLIHQYSSLMKSGEGQNGHSGLALLQKACFARGFTRLPPCPIHMCWKMNPLISILLSFWWKVGQLKWSGLEKSVPWGIRASCVIQSGSSKSRLLIRVGWCLPDWHIQHLCWGGPNFLFPVIRVGLGIEFRYFYGTNWTASILSSIKTFLVIQYQMSVYLISVSEAMSKQHANCAQI